MLGFIWFKRTLFSYELMILFVFFYQVHKLNSLYMLLAELTAWPTYTLVVLASVMEGYSEFCEGERGCFYRLDYFLGDLCKRFCCLNLLNFKYALLLYCVHLGIWPLCIWECPENCSHHLDYLTYLKMEIADAVGTDNCCATW